MPEQVVESLENKETPIAQEPSVTPIVDLEVSPLQNQDQEVNDNDGAGDDIRTPPPRVLTSSVGYVHPSHSASTNSALNMGLFIRPGEWIETTPMYLTPEKVKYFEIPPCMPEDPWNPKIDLLRGELVLIDDC